MVWDELHSFKFWEISINVLGLDENISKKLGLDINGKIVRAWKWVILLDITGDNILTFVNHIEELYRRANQESSAIQRIVHLIDDEKAKLLYNAYFLSKFEILYTHRPFCSLLSNKLINRTYEEVIES